MITIVCYDIANSKRLRNLHSFLKDYGVATQKSVFECDISLEEINSITKYCLKNLNKQQDSVRIYKVCSACIRKIIICGISERVLNVDYQVV